jgi:hydroxypyruvate isomerase
VRAARWRRGAADHQARRHHLLPLAHHGADEAGDGPGHGQLRHRRGVLRDRGQVDGEIQVADVPGRCEPGTGEIHYPAVAAALHRLGYDGVVGLEGWASGDPDVALERFRAAFTI